MTSCDFPGPRNASKKLCKNAEIRGKPSHPMTSWDLPGPWNVFKKLRKNAEIRGKP